MKLSKILKNTNIKIDNDIDIKNISINSKNIEKDSLFVAIKGYIRDGHDYIDEAINNGASVIIVDNDRYNDFKDRNALILPVDNSRKICSIIACNFYNNPSKEFKLIGVTGTKGKTTTCYIIKNMLQKAGKRVGMITTVASYINDKKISDNDRTTPEPFILQKIFYDMKNQGCEYVVMEVSSQSLKLGRVDHSYFDIGMFLNLSEEHVSEFEHSSIEDYYLCKTKLFDMVKVGFTNIDDPKGRELINIKPNCKFITISLEDTKDIAISYKYTSFKTDIYNNTELVNIPILGKYSVYNAMFAIKLGEYLNIDKNAILEGINSVIVPGRCELIENDKNLTIMIDYAHNSSSLKSILAGLKNFVIGNLITVFGCAGNRDSSKREEMGKISGLLSDYTIITTDNPEYEDPKEICNEIENGIKEITDNYEIILDREEAIKKAISIANKNDIILLAGKGHETYQTIKGEKIPFTEKEIIQKYTRN